MTSTTAKRPAGVKQPQDRQSKTEKPTIEKVDGGRTITHRGITITVPDEAWDDFELLDDLRATQEGDPTRLPSLLRRLAGEEGYRAVMNGLRDPNTKRVSLEAGGGFVGEIFEALQGN